MEITFSPISGTEPEVFLALSGEHIYFLLFWRSNSEQLGQVKSKQYANKLWEAEGEKDSFFWTSEYLMLSFLKGSGTSKILLSIKPIWLNSWSKSFISEKEEKVVLVIY